MIMYSAHISVENLQYLYERAWDDLKKKLNKNYYSKQSMPNNDQRKIKIEYY